MGPLRFFISEADRIFSDSIAELYDRFLGPLPFEPYATDLAARAARLKPAKLLEITAGTGVATRALARALPKTACIVATNLNQPMVDFAAAHSDGRIDRRQADALRLPFEDESCDLVVCQFGAMFFPDKTGAYREARRVLRLGGHFIFSIWDRLEENELSQIVSDALAALFPRDPPRFLERIPFGYHNTTQIRSELHSVGFRSTTWRGCNAAAAPRPRARRQSAYARGIPGAMKSRRATGTAYLVPRKLLLLLSLFASATGLLAPKCRPSS